MQWLEHQEHATGELTESDGEFYRKCKIVWIELSSSHSFQGSADMI